MAERMIPEQKVLVCDRCKAEGVRGEAGPFYHGGAHAAALEQWGMTYDGSVAAPAGARA